MKRMNTIGNKRGSVRGPPPSVYIPFGGYGPDPAEVVRPALNFFGNLIKIAIGFIILMFLLVAFAAIFREDA